MKTRVILAVWIAGLLIALAVLLFRTPITSDLTFFLPRMDDPMSRIIQKAASEGPGTRLLLIEIAGGDTRQQFDAADALSESLRPDPRFVRIQKGIDRQDLLELESRLFPYRFVLSPLPFANPLDPIALKGLLEERYRELTRGSGRLMERWIHEDPWGQWPTFLKHLQDQVGPRTQGGHWVGPEGNTTLMLALTRAPGFDLEAQESAIESIEQAFQDLKTPHLTLRIGGAGALSVETNARISKEAGWLSLGNTLMVSALLLWVYRSARILLLGLIPLGTGLITAALAVRLESGALHAITLGFGSTLLGVAADYPNHFFTHLDGQAGPRQTMRHLWPTLRLGILTNIAGFGVMFFSGFRGLEELGIFAACGLLGAGLATRYILPAWAPHQVTLHPGFTRLRHLGAVRLPLPQRVGIALILPWVAGVWALMGPTPLFDDQFTHLNPVAPDRLQADLALQRAFQVEDMRRMIIITGADEESVLLHAERLRPTLEALRSEGALEGFELLSDLLPSQETQARRLAAIPDPEALKAAFRTAIPGTPFEAAAFDPLMRDLKTRSSLPPLTRATYQGTALEPRLDALLMTDRETVSLMVPLQGIQRPEAIDLKIAQLGIPNIQILDVGDTLSQHLRENRLEAFRLVSGGLVVIGGVLMLGLRSPTRALRVFGPMLLATVTTGFLLARWGGGLNIYHLAAMLLVMGLSLDQALFFNRPHQSADERIRSQISIGICALSAIFAFGGLGLSSVPLLATIGQTVALGAFLALLFSAWLADPPKNPR